MKQDEIRLTTSEKLEIFKFYEAAAEKTKAHAWTQTTWILPPTKLPQATRPLYHLWVKTQPQKQQRKGYHAEFPQFCRRLQYLAVLFIAAHIGWALIVALRLAA